MVDMNDDVCGIETQDDWVELSYEMWNIRSVNRSYVNNFTEILVKISINFNIYKI
jgi:hypothetical protein